MKLRPTQHETPVQKVNVHEIDLAHAHLSASGAHRWLNCTASVWMEQHFANVDTSYSEEGTRAHSVGSDCLEQGIDVTEWVKRLHRAIRHELESDLRDRIAQHIATQKPAERMADILSGMHSTMYLNVSRLTDDELPGFAETVEYFEELYPQDMLDAVAGYLEYVHERIAEARERNPDAFVLVERRVDFSQWVPEGFGHLDLGVLSDGVGEVVDYKHGAGVYVDATDCEQTMLYALGLYKMYRHMFEFRLFRLTIYQPRKSNIQTWEIGVAQLLRWAERRVQPVANVVWASLQNDDLSGVEFDPSDPEMCRFCRAKVHCRARAERMLGMAQYEKDVALMTDAEVHEVLGEAEHLGKWASDLKTWAATQAAKGTKIRGWKLVEGRANRRYVSENRVASILRMEGFRPEQFQKPRKLLGLTDMTSLLKGKKNLDRLLGGLITKPTGRPVLVPESDPRPVFAPPQDATGQGFEVDEE